MPKLLSIIIPVYNEEKIIPELYQRVSDVASNITDDYELIFVNDGSRDHTFLEIINLAEKDKHVFYINFSRNFGHQIAVTAGLDKCRGHFVAIIDGDMQDPPELIKDMYDKMQEGYDVVYAKRNKRKGESFFKKATAKLFYRLLRNITDIDIPLDTGDFRIMKRKVVDYLKKMPEQNKFLRGQITWLGFKQTAVLFDRDKRKYGSTGYPLKKMLRFALDGITSFSDKPLIFVSKLGLIISILAVCIIFYALYSHFVIGKTVTGWTSLIISTMFIGGIQLVSIGIIGLYISRMNKNILNRPLYIIDESNLED
ncbi:MAG: glycosyltransferase family 2 protein [Chitinophagaceae bacterium]